MGKGKWYFILETAKISDIEMFPVRGMSGFVCKDILHRNKGT